MSTLYLKSSLCKNCGYCCFDCSFLGDNGCTDLEYSSKTRCGSFPIIFGNSSRMGYNNLYELSDPDLHENPNKIKSFILEYPKCHLFQKERIFNVLRWFVNDINKSDKKVQFFVSFNTDNLYIEYNPTKKL